MAYEKNLWINNRTKLNAANLNNIEDGIDQTRVISDEAKTLASEANTLSKEAKAKSTEALTKAEEAETAVAKKQNKLAAGSNIIIDEDANIISVSNDFSNRVANLETGLGAEIDRAKAAEGTLQSNIDKEQRRAEAAEGTLTYNLGQEVTDRKTADNSLSDRINNLEARGRFLSSWDASTGNPETYPDESQLVENKYYFKAGDYYIVSKVGTSNRMPDGTYIEKLGPTWIVQSKDATGPVNISDYYTFDGKKFLLVQNTQKEVTFRNIAGEPNDNVNLKNALATKLETYEVTVKPGDPEQYKGVANVPVFFERKTEDNAVKVTAHSIALNTTKEQNATPYTMTVLEAGDNISLDGLKIHATDTTYTAGRNITIDENNVISATDLLTAVDPSGTGSLSMNRLADTTIGTNSVALGNYTTASGNYSHAEGNYTKATGTQSHAEGYLTTASNSCAHAEGHSTTANGGYAHAEGKETVASGWSSHAEGNGTTANHKAQHVFGEFNAIDTATTSIDSRGNFIEIVGNGLDSGRRSNARTLDWAGNEYLAGDLKAAGLTDGTTRKSITDILAGGGLPEATVGQALVHDGTKWAKQDNYGYSTSDEDKTISGSGSNEKYIELELTEGWSRTCYRVNPLKNDVIKAKDLVGTKITIKHANETEAIITIAENNILSALENGASVLKFIDTAEGNAEYYIVIIPVDTSEPIIYTFPNIGSCMAIDKGIYSTMREE